MLAASSVPKSWNFSLSRSALDRGGRGRTWRRRRRRRRRHGNFLRYGHLLALHSFDRELVDPLRLVDALEVPLAAREDRHAVGQRRAEQRPRRLREQDVAASRGRADARGADDVEAEVALLHDRRLARVQAHADADGGALGPFVRRVRTLRLDRGRDRVACAREREEERIALGIDLDPVRRHEGLADEPPMCREDVPIVTAELLQELGRALDVGEHEGHGSAGQGLHGRHRRPVEPVGACA